MKKGFERYTRGSMEQLREKLSPNNKKILNDFLEFCGTTACESRVKNIERYLLQIQDTMEVDLDKITEKEVISFLKLLKQSNKREYTKNDLKKALKRFLVRQDLNWHLTLKTITGIRTKKETNKKITKNDLLKTGELNTLMKLLDSLKWKAYLITNWETGARPEELRLLKWKALDLETKEITLYSNKTGKSRPILLNNSIIHLKRWKQEYPFENVNGNDFVFPSRDNRYKPMSESSLTEYFQRWGKKYLGRALYPYIVRHTRLVFVRQKLSPEAYVKFAGHSMEVALETYGHLDTDDVNQELLTRVYNEEESTEEEKIEIKELKLEIEQLKATHQQEMNVIKHNLNQVANALVVLRAKNPSLYSNQEIQTQLFSIG